MRIEEILDEPEHLDVLRHLIATVKINGPVGGYFGKLVGVIVNEILAADDVEICAKLPGISDVGRQL